MKLEELPLYRTLFELVTAVDSAVTQFPRELKYSYGEELRRLGLALLEDIAMANYCVGNLKKRAEYLENALGHYEAYKFSKRVCEEKKALPAKKSATIDKGLAEVGAQIMGWYNKYEKHLNRQ